MPLLRFKIMSLHGFLLLLCVSANAGAPCDCPRANAVLVKNGENVTMQCSIDLKGLDGMHLYRGPERKEKVLYYDISDKVTPEGKYRSRVQAKGTLKNNTITISNLTRSDTGIYTCVYMTFRPSQETPSNLYILIVNDEVPGPGPLTSLMPCPNGRAPSPLLIVISSCTLTTLTIIFGMLIVTGVKRYIGVRSKVHRPEDPKEYVYEEMNQSNRPPAVTMQSS